MSREIEFTGSDADTSNASAEDFESNVRRWLSHLGPDLTSSLDLLRQELERAIADGSIVLPDRFRAVRHDNYARRLVYSDPVTNVAVLVMVWLPGQGTPLHDHAGLWVVEAVLAGEVESVTFDLAGQENGNFFFHPRPARRETVGATSCLIPPFEHHVMRNVSDQVAITLQVYGGEMRTCNVFLPAGNGSYQRHLRVLSYAD